MLDERLQPGLTALQERPKKAPRTKPKREMANVVVLSGGVLLAARQRHELGAEEQQRPTCTCQVCMPMANAKRQMSMSNEMQMQM